MLTNVQKFVKFFINIINNIISRRKTFDYISNYYICFSFKNIDDEEKKIVDNEVNILNMLLTDQTFILKSPIVRYFSDMKEFKPFTESFKLSDCIVKLCEE